MPAATHGRFFPVGASFRAMFAGHLKKPEIAVFLNQKSRAFWDFYNLARPLLVIVRLMPVCDQV